MNITLSRMLAAPPPSAALDALGMGHRRGSALITTMWVVIAITGLVLVMSQSMRVEAIASANRMSQIQAETMERGVEQFLCSVIDQEVASPGSTLNVSMEGRQLGDGYFWVMKPSPDDETTRMYGLTDEAGKVDLNTAPLSMLQLLPNIPQEVASSIYNWRGTATAGDGLGATDADYGAMPDPYRCKHSPFETTEELLLIKGMTPDLLFGYDKNRNGVLDGAEQQSGGISASFNSAISSGRGIFPFVTAYGQLATNAAMISTTGQRTVDVNTSPRQQLQRALQNGLSGGRLSAVINTTVAARGRGNRGNYRNVFDWANQVGLTTAEFSSIFTRVTVTPTGATARLGKLNVNTASRQALMCLPAFEQSDADAIISHRQMSASANPQDISWLMDVVARSKLSFAGGYVTGKSTVYSGDIVTVSADGRAFRRCRVVIDGGKTPAYVIYRRDLTSAGWPLTADIQTAMRNGQAPPDANAPASNSNSLLGKGL